MSSHKKRVVVPQLAGHDFNEAGQYGEVIELLSGQFSPFNLDSLRTRIKKRLTEIEVTADDYLALSGTAVVNCLTFLEWLNMHGRVELLLFHSRDLEYIHRTFIKERA